MMKTDYQIENAVLITIRKGGVAEDGTPGYYGETLYPEDVSTATFQVVTISPSHEDAVTATVKHIPKGSIIVELPNYDFYREMSRRQFYNAKAKTK